MVKVIVLCGKVGSGKTTYAKKLSEALNAVVLSVDEWMLTVYGRDIPCSEHKMRVELVEKALYREGHKILKRGVPIIFDFGYWTKEERNLVKKEFDTYEVEIHYIETEESLLYERVIKRNAEGLELEYQMSMETHKVLNSRFEVPSEDEHVVKVMNTQIPL